MANKYAGTQTEKNLMAAFSGESEARNKYTYFASKAKKEGFEQIAALFLKTADNEKEHAKLWFKELEGIGSTAENLAAAAAGEQKKEGTLESIKGALSHKNLVFGVIAIFLYVGIEVGIPNMANLYMTSPDGLGMAAGVAGTLVGAYWFLMLCGRLVGGAVGGKVSSRAMMTFVSSLAIVFVLLGMFLPETLTMSLLDAQVPVGMVCFVLCGLCTSIMWGAIFNLAVEGLGKYTSIASGLFMVMVCGGGLLPLLQGYVADLAGYIPSYWVIIAALAYTLWFALSGSKVNK
jgi:FHS family L-fucose permease-like MFS transporter